MRNELQETRQKGYRTLLAIFIIGLAVYLGFAPLFKFIDNGIASEVIGSSFAAIFVIILTMYLINKQTEIEQESKKSERVFDEKVKLYQKLLVDTKEILEDNYIDRDEVSILPFTLINLQMIGADEVIKSYKSVYQRIMDIFSSSDSDEVEIESSQKDLLILDISKFASKCRVDLGISENEVEAELFEETSKILKKSNTVIGRNKPIDEDVFPVVSEASVTLSDSILYSIKRYKDSSIRIYADKNTNPVKNTKNVLRKINEEQELGFTEEEIKNTNTRVVGRKIIDLIKRK